MRIGLQLPEYKWPGGDRQIGAHLSEIAQAADAAGFYSLWVMDHFYQISMIGPLDDPMLESYSTLSYIAGQTQQIKLGALVTAAPYRYPGVLLKTVTTLDVLSGGRAYLGIGAGWFEREARGLGIPFPGWKQRFELLEETLQAAHSMWSASPQPVLGRHSRLEEPVNQPQPLTRPRPPILVGGMGEKKTLKLLAQYGDACNLVSTDPVFLQGKLDVLRQHCESLGRDFAEIEKTVLTGVDVRPDGAGAIELLETCRRLAGVGIEHLIVNMPEVYDLKRIAVFAREIIPAAAEL